MKKKLRLFLPLLMACLLPWQAQAALFEDSDARRSILDLRARVNEKADNAALLELSKQNEILKQEIAKLRGQIEVLTNENKNLQQRQKDLYVDLDARIAKMEPQEIEFDGKKMLVSPDEKRLFEAVDVAFRDADYARTVSSCNTFLSRYPGSSLAVHARFILGNAYYLLKDYKNALASQTEFIKKYPASEKVPEVMLTMASSQIGLKDISGAKKTLDNVIKQHPDSTAATEAKQRLNQMK